MIIKSSHDCIIFFEKENTFGDPPVLINVEKKQALLKDWRAGKRLAIRFKNLSLFYSASTTLGHLLPVHQEKRYNPS